MTGANSRQVGGSHYASSLQHWDVATKWGVQCMEYAATKYVTRWRKKAGLQDLEKAGHYLQKLLECCAEPGAQAKRVRLTGVGFGIVPDLEVFNFCIINALPYEEATFCRLLFTWNDVGALHEAEAILKAMIQKEKDRLAAIKAEEDARPRDAEPEEERVVDNTGQANVRGHEGE